MSAGNPFGKSATKTAQAKNDQFDTPTSTKPVETKPAAAAGAASDPFSSPPGVSGEKITDFVGVLMLVKPTEYIESMDTSIGTTDVVRADVALLDGDRAGDQIEDMLVFQTALKRDLTRVLDGDPSKPFVLARLGKGQAKKGKSAPFIFNQPEDEDVAIARAFLAAN